MQFLTVWVFHFALIFEFMRIMRSFFVVMDNIMDNNSLGKVNSYPMVMGYRFVVSLSIYFNEID